MGVSRRALVIGGAGALLAGCSGEPPAATPHQAEPASTAPKPVRTTVATTFTSKARGREVRMITMAPDGHSPDTLPKCVALHGRGGDVNTMVALEVQKHLSAVVSAGTKPFAVVSVDGGPETYWVDGEPGDDPQRMLLSELGPIQAAFGISMGGFGALRFARGREELKAVAAISPALFRDWATARSKQVFASQKHWEDNEPLRHTAELDSREVGVWCGSSDPFLPVAKALAAQTRPAKAVFGPGGHDQSYWQAVLPEVLAFVGERISATA